MAGPDRILVVDDEPRMRESVKALLAAEGYAVTEAADGPTALAHLREDPADLVLADLSMPGMSGIDLVDRLREEHPGTAVIIFTGYGTLQTAVEAIRRGVVDYIVKPFDFETLRQSVARALQSVEQKRLLAQTTEELEDAKKTLEVLAITDELTGLPNLRYLRERLQQEVARTFRSGSALSVALIDLDRFKEVNDHHGHSVGDQVLIFYARLLAQSVREVDVLGRYGGDEFLLILPDTPISRAATLLERLRERIAESRFNLQEISVNLTISIGLASPEFVSSGTSDGDPAALTKALFEAADQALYKAKHAGRNRLEGGNNPDTLVIS